jgi:hypothetical protein
MADAHKDDDHGHAHGHGDDHGHGHGAAAGDIISEDSPQDMVLTLMAMLTLAGLMTMMFWFYQPGGEPPAHHAGGAETHIPASTDGEGTPSGEHH